MTKEKPLEEYLEDDEFKGIEQNDMELEGIEEDKDELKDIEEVEDDLEGIEQDKNELEGIEPDEEDKIISEQLRKISAKDPSGPQKRIIHSVPVFPSPILEKMMEENSEQNLEMQLEEAPMPEKREEDELDYSGQKKEENGLYGDAKKLEGTYDPQTRTTRFNKDEASAFDSDAPREINYTGNGMDGTQEKGMRNDYEIKGPNTRVKRFDRSSASAFDSDSPREYEISK